MNDTNNQFKKQLPKNAISAIISFLLYTLSTIWLTPYLVRHLGAAAYGLIPLAGLFTQYVSIITAQLQGSVNRFLTIEIQKPGGDANTIFNSAFALYLILALIQVPFFVAGLFFVNKIFSIPAELYHDALLLLGCSSFAFLVDLLSAVFGTSLFSKNRLDIGNGVQISRLILRLVLIVLCFSLCGPKLRYIGYVDLGLTIIYSGVSVALCKRFTPELKLSFRSIDYRVLGPIFKMSLWSLITQLGALLYHRSDIWIINRFISPIAAGQYAAIMVIANFIRQLGGMFAGQLGPTIMSYWAKDERVHLRRMLSFSIKILACMLAIPAALICINAGGLLALWLGDDYSRLSFLLAVLVVHLPINVAVQPLFTFHSASNTIKLPALVTLLMGIMNVILSFYLGVTLEMGALGVALATALVLTSKNALFTPLYAAYVLDLKPLSFMVPLLSSVLMMVAVYLVSLIPVAAWFGIEVDGLMGIVSQSVVACFVGAIMIWCFGLSKNERTLVAKMIPDGIRAKLPVLNKL
jgi:membrane protein EpsK